MTEREVLRGRRTEVVTLAGPDATSLLSTQVSQGIQGLEVGEATWSLVLEPDGSLGHWVRVARAGSDRWCVVGAQGRASALLERLSRFRLREKADLLVETMAIVVLDAGEDVAGIELPAIWAGQGEREILVEDVEAMAEPRGVEELEARRIIAGRLSPDDLTEGDNPFAIGSAAVAASTSFTKGCYTGQELVARMDARGAAAPKRLVIGASSGGLRPGMALLSDGKEVGVVRSSADGRTAVCLVARAVPTPSSEAVSCGSEWVALVDPHGGS